MKEDGQLMSSTMETNESLDRMLTVNEVAHLLHVHPTTVRRWEKRGELKSHRLGLKGTIRFKREEVLSFVDSGALNIT
jgi:excisionase family DNA binding protein